MNPLAPALVAAVVALAATSVRADPCQPGHFSIDGQDPCTPCEAGTYSASSGATSCADCEPHTASSAGSSECGICPYRYYQPEAGSPSCETRNDRSCWTVRDLRNPAPFSPMMDVSASDEISTQPISLHRPSLICGAAGIESRFAGANSSSTMCCYKTDGARPEAPVSIEWNSILGGTLQVRIVRRALFCDQCQGSTETEQPQQCWKVRDLKNPKFAPYGGLRVSDAYSFDFLLVRKPAMFCSPTAFDGVPVVDTMGQYCCFNVGKAYVSEVSRNVTAPLGEPLELGVMRRSMLCEPCTASVLP